MSPDGWNDGPAPNTNAWTAGPAPTPSPTQSASPAPYQTTGQIAKDVVAGVIKQPGRLVQMIPGVATATDKVFGLTPGSSAQAMQPTNTAQKIGGYVADAAEIAAGGAADSGMVYTRNAAGQFIKAPFMQSLAGKGAQMIGEVSQGAIQAAKTALLGSGPVTTTKIGALVGKYGVAAVKAAMTGLGLGAGYEAWEKLTK